MGSSPLTRGKFARAVEVGPWEGLIPAHAGKIHMKTRGRR